MMLIKVKTISLIQYKSAAEIVQAYSASFAARAKEVDGIDIDDEPVEWGDEEFSLNDEQIIRHLNDSGFWAFADTWEKTIHAWFDPRIDELQRFRVLAHEFAHLTGKPCEDPEKEEHRCDAFMENVTDLFRLWKQVCDRLCALSAGFRESRYSDGSGCKDSVKTGYHE